MTRKIFVVSDIHGEYDKLLRLMDKILDKRTKDDLIIFLGDYIDRGKQSNRVINYIFNLKSNDDNIITLLGNHDMAFWESMRSIETLDIYGVEWFARYCIETLEAYQIDTKPLKSFEEDNQIFYTEYFKKFVEEVKALKKTEEYRKFDILMCNSKLYHREGKYIFTHSGGVHYKDVSKQTVNELLWSRDFAERNDGHIHVCGHTPTITGTVEEHNDVLLCDVGAVYRDIELPLIELEVSNDE